LIAVRLRRSGGLGAVCVKTGALHREPGVRLLDEAKENMLIFFTYFL
jgi:hypothetical protein